MTLTPETLKELFPETVEQLRQEELLACYAYLRETKAPVTAELLLKARKAACSKKQRALEALDRVGQFPTNRDLAIVREALEELDD